MRADLNIWADVTSALLIALLIAGLLFVWPRMKPATQRRVCWAIGIGLILFIIVSLFLSFADTYTSEDAKQCAPSLTKAKLPMWLGCAMTTYEDLAAGLFAGAAALFAAWLAFQAVQEQMAADREHEQQRRNTEQDRELRTQTDAKPVAEVCLQPTVDAAAAALLAVNRAIEASRFDQADRDQIVTLMARHARSTLRSPMIMEGLRDLGTQDRVHYLAIVATVNGFINVRLESQPSADQRAVAGDRTRGFDVSSLPS